MSRAAAAWIAPRRSTRVSANPNIGEAPRRRPCGIVQATPPSQPLAVRGCACPARRARRSPQDSAWAVKKGANAVFIVAQQTAERIGPGRGCHWNEAALWRTGMDVFLALGSRRPPASASAAPSGGPRCRGGATLATAVATVGGPCCDLFAALQKLFSNPMQYKHSGRLKNNILCNSSLPIFLLPGWRTQATNAAGRLTPPVAPPATAVTCNTSWRATNRVAPCVPPTGGGRHRWPFLSLSPKRPF